MGKNPIDSICFIGGGQMAEALIKGILSKHLIKRENIFVSEPLEARRKYLEENYAIKTFSDNKEAVKGASAILIAVKPQVIDVVLRELRESITEDKFVISIAAGITLKRLQKLLGKDKRIIRVMPNTPCLVQSVAAGISKGEDAKKEDMEATLWLFNSLGKAVEVPENLMDAVTGLSGSGPAYCFLFIEALIQAGIREGLPRPTASLLAIQTVIGSAKMCLETGKQPGELISMVTSPGGTTIQGLYELERAGLSGIVMDAVRAATKRSKELGES